MSSKKYRGSLVGLLCASCLGLAGQSVAAQDRPNVVIIYFDDMGYSDVGFNAPSQPSVTPRLDQLASEGMTFTRGYSADAVCTPSRYALMTGRYAWRTALNTGVIGAYDAPLIEDDRFTIAHMFNDHGYHTAAVGKWHLGVQYYDPDGNPVSLGRNENVLGNDVSSTSDDLIDFSHPLTSGPRTNGFDYFFGTGASPGTPPYVWLENDRVMFQGGLVTEDGVDFSQARPATNADFEEGRHPEGLRATRNGAYDPTFVIRDYLQIQAARATEVISETAAAGEPLFLYVPMASPHLPWGVQAQFDGTTPNTYADYLAQGDYYAGLILDALADPDGDPATDDGIEDNTIVIMTSDNGPEFDGQQQSLADGRDTNGPFRGIKRESWEGGTRVPFVVRWPGRIEAGAVVDAPVTQVDITATLADVLGYQLQEGEAGDSESALALWEGYEMQSERREGFITHSVSGQFAIIDETGEWKFIDGTGGAGNRNRSGSWDADDQRIQNPDGTMRANPRQLFNLFTDPGEDDNLMLGGTPDAVQRGAEMYSLLNEIRGDTTFGSEGDSNVPSSDSDGDGILNFFEEAYPELDPNDPRDAARDDDGDGFTNLEEFRARTDPGDRGFVIASYNAGTEAVSTTDRNSQAFQPSTGADTATALTVGPGLTGGGAGSFIHHGRSFFNTSVSRSPVYNFANGTGANRAEAALRGTTVSFTIEGSGEFMAYDSLAFYANQNGGTARMDIVAQVGEAELVVLEGFRPIPNNGDMREQTVTLANLVTDQDVTFTMYFYGASNVMSGTRIDDIRVSGQAAPESSALARFEATGADGDFDTAAFAPSLQASGLQVSSLRQGGGLTGGGRDAFIVSRPYGSSSLSGTPSFNFGDVTADIRREANSGGDFVEFVVTPTEDGLVTYDRLELFANQFDEGAQIAVSAIIDGGERVFQSNIQVAGSNAPLGQVVVDFDAFPSTQPVTWRIYLYGASHPSYGLRLDDIELFGW